MYKTFVSAFKWLALYVKTVSTRVLYTIIYKLLLPLLISSQTPNSKHYRLLIFMWIFLVVFVRYLLLVGVHSLLFCLHCALCNIYGEYCKFFSLFLSLASFDNLLVFFSRRKTLAFVQEYSYRFLCCLAAVSYSHLCNT